MAAHYPVHFRGWPCGGDGGPFVKRQLDSFKWFTIFWATIRRWFSISLPLRRDLIFISVVSIVKCKFSSSAQLGMGASRLGQRDRIAWRR
jgi:hypothetical protein